MHSRKVARWLYRTLKDHTDGDSPQPGMIGVTWGVDSNVIVVTDDDEHVQSWAISVVRLH